MFKRFILSLSLLVLFLHASFSQNQTMNWHFGAGAGLSFKTGVAVSTNSSMSSWQGCASISDTSGNTLFYTNGETVWNSAGYTMENGNNIGGNEFAGQSSIIIPKPGSTTEYFLVTTVNDGQNGISMRYSVVDMSYNNGLGKITEKATVLAYSSADRLTVVKHSNKIDYWLATTDYHGSKIRVYLITALGISTTPVVTESNLNFSENAYIKFSPNGKYLATANSTSLFRFNDSNGTLSLITQLDNSLQIYGVEFSPDNSKLYASSTYTSQQSIVQYDLDASDISASKVFIDTDCQAYPTPCPTGYYGTLQMAPDGKIYHAVSGSYTLNTIEEPNKKGVGCNFQKSSFSINGMCRFGLPNFISSYFNTENSNSRDDAEGILVYPNPATDFVILSMLSAKNITLALNLAVYDVSGIERFRAENISLMHNYMLSTTDLPSGIFYFKFFTDDKVLYHGKFCK